MGISQHIHDRFALMDNSFAHLSSPFGCSEEAEMSLSETTSIVQSMPKVHAVQLKLAKQIEALNEVVIEESRLALLPCPHKA